MDIEGLGFLEGKKPFYNGKTINWKNTEFFVDFCFFWSENLVIFDRKLGNFGNGVKFDFSVAALHLC